MTRARAITEEAAEAAVDTACRVLRLPTIRGQFAEAADKAERDQLTYRGFLAELLMAECEDRDRRRAERQVRGAGFPRAKWLADFDYDANPGISPAVLSTLAACNWVRKGQPLCLIGDSGTGKSHLLIALGTAAAMAGFRVRYTLASKLANELAEAADDRQLTKTIARYGRADLLCIDELGYMELDRRGAELLFQVLTEREETASVAIASNESFSKAHMFAATCVRRQPKMHGFAGGEGGSAAAGKREPSYQPGKSAPPTSRWPDRGGRLSGLTVTHPAASIQCAVVGPARVRVAGLGPGRDNGSMVPAGEALAYLRTATEDLVAVISGLSDSAVRGPSLLPGWSRGHVLTHLARNAEGGVRLLGWARTGVPSYEYESLEARAAAIEDGAGRLAVVLIDEVRRAADAFSAAAAGMPSEAWDRKVRWTAGQESPASLIVPSRWGEVLIHHVDLDIGYQPADWPSVFTGELLPFIVSDLSGRGAMDAVRLKATDAGRVFTIGEITPASLTIAGPACELLAWLLGRSDGGRLARKPDAPLPAVPAIY